MNCVQTAYYMGNKLLWQIKFEKKLIRNNVVWGYKKKETKKGGEKIFFIFNIQENTSCINTDYLLFNSDNMIYTGVKNTRTTVKNTRQYIINIITNPTSLKYFSVPVSSVLIFFF